MRGGREVYLPKSKGKFSISVLFETYLSMAKIRPGMNHFLICQIRYDPLTGRNSVINSILSYSSCRDIIKSAISAIGLDPSLYAMHSARSGGASDLAIHATAHELQLSGRWNDPRSIGHYVETSKERRLHLARTLNLND